MKNKQDKIMILGLAVSLIVGMYGLGLGIKDLKRDVIEKDIQINSMAEEIGYLKEENQYIYQNLVLGIDSLGDSFENLHSSLKQVFDQESIEAVNAELSGLVAEKENVIDQLQNRNEQLKKELNIKEYPSDVLTILILGTNENLADTIILASINPSKETITLISVPRDLYVNGRKINSIYPSYGIEKMKQDLSKISGLDIKKYVVFDFKSFKEAIDILGGIDIEVREDIYDPYFPTANNGYTKYSIKKGNYVMDGEQALMYVRSRKTTSDFDRSKRQQQVIQAIRGKVKMLDLLADIDKAVELYNSVIKNIKTDVGVFDALGYFEKYKNYSIESGNVISTDNFLYSSKTTDGQYILLPNGGDYVDIKKAISALIID